MRRRHLLVLALLVAVAGCVDRDTSWTEQLTDGVLGLVLGDTASEPGGEQAPALDPGEVVVSGPPLPRLDAGLGDPAIGMQAPVVTGAGFDREPVVIGEAGHPTAIVFLAHWCPHCQNEVPRVQTWLDQGGGVAGVEILSVATAIDANLPNYPPVAWLEREGWRAPVLVDDDWASAFEVYGGTGYPFWVFLDASGRVVRRTAGELDIEDLEQYLAETKANA